MTTQNSLKLPIEYRDETIYAQDGSVARDVDSVHGLEIVTALNAHAVLVGALERVLDFEERLTSCPLDGGHQLVFDIRAALLLARGQGKPSA
jgi:hypothetical protein